MLDERFHKLYELAQNKVMKQIEKEYEELKKVDDSISFDEYKEEIEKNKSKKSNNSYEDNYIFKEQINKDLYIFNLYLIHFPFSTPVRLDEDYNVIPIEEKEIYESGVILTNSNDKGTYLISGLFSNVCEDKDLATEHYNELKEIINNSSIEKLFDDIENQLK